MKISTALFALTSLAMLSGCFPTMKTNEVREWDGPKRDDGTHLAIKAQYTQKYLFILLTPEGQKFSPRGKAKYRYFIGRTTGEKGQWSDVIELPWLALEVDQIDSWGDVTALNETPYWYAIRYLDKATPWHKYEILIFSRAGVKSRRTITAKSFPEFVDDRPAPIAKLRQPVTTVYESSKDPQTGAMHYKVNGKEVTSYSDIDNGRWALEPDCRIKGWGDTPPLTLEVEYDAPDGRRRYHVINNIDQLIGADGKPTRSNTDASPLHFEIPNLSK